MAVISRDAFKSPVVGIDPITKGTFTIIWAEVLLDYDEEYEIRNTRATGNVLIEGYNNNPLFAAVKANPLRLQHLIGSVMFGAEKMFVRFDRLEDFEVIDDDIVKEVDLILTFEILNNLEYLEYVTEYKKDNSL